jgi:DNA invertase Pin-like site-specific DNA recombinase
MTILAYLRVSTNEQADSGAGIAAQRAAILAEAEKRGWSIPDIKWLKDEGFSGKSLKRPQIQQALEMLNAGEASILMVAKMDRLSRSMLDFASLMQRAQKEGWALVALDSPADLTTPSGEAMAAVMMVFSQLERRLIGERTKAALAIKRAEGVKLGRPRALPNEIAVRILDETRAGQTPTEIARGLNADGVPTARGAAEWKPVVVRQIVKSRLKDEEAVPAC